MRRRGQNSAYGLLRRFLISFRFPVPSFKSSAASPRERFSSFSFLDDTMRDRGHRQEALLMRRPLFPIFILVALALSVGAAQQAQGPGQIRPRPGTGREPEFPPPKITDYKPKSTLVVPEHPVPRAKFPV